MHWLPITAAMGEVLSSLQQCLHQGTANTGVAVSIYPVGKPRAAAEALSLQARHGDGPRAMGGDQDVQLRSAPPP